MAVMFLTFRSEWTKSDRECSGYQSLDRESDSNGQELRRIDAPENHAPNGNEKTGVYQNNGPEAMTVLSSGEYALTIIENALVQDGEKNTVDPSSTNKITV